MKLIQKISIRIFILFFINSFGQNTDSTANLIPILPHWEINDVHTFNIKFSEKDVLKKESTEYILNFNASFKILEKNKKNYLLSWTFNSAKLAEGKPNKESLIISNLLHKEILIKFSPFGEYIEIVNDESIRLAATKIIDDLIAKETNPGEKLDLNYTKQLITTKEGLEASLLKSVKIYFLPFGHQYPINQEMTYNLKYPNILGGNEPFDAVEKVNLRMTENDSEICLIEANQIIDTKQFLKDYRIFLKNRLNYKDNDIEVLISKYKVGVQESLTHQLNLKKGTLLKMSFKRIIDLSILTKTIGYEVNIVN